VIRSFIIAGVLVWSTAWAAGADESSDSARLELAKARLAAAGKRADLKVVEGLGHREAFRIRSAGEKMVVEAASVEDLAQRHCMPVSQYAECLEAGKPVTDAMTPDKVTRLLHTRAEESLTLAREMEAACADPARKPELRRFVTDSQMYALATEAMIHKEDAAIFKARMLLSNKADKADEFMREMEASVTVYEQLAALTDDTYHFANGLYGRHWSREGIGEFRNDLQKQQEWLKKFKSTRNGESRIILPSSRSSATYGASPSDRDWLANEPER